MSMTGILEMELKLLFLNEGSVTVITAASQQDRCVCVGAHVCVQILILRILLAVRVVSLPQVPQWL